MCATTLLNISCFNDQGKWDVPLPKVRAVGQDEVFKVIKTGKSRSKIRTLFFTLSYKM